MDFLNSKFVLGSTSGIVGVLAACGLVLWWLIRKRVKRVWLPTVKILNLPKKSLPKLTYIKPPILPFICFLLSSLGILIYSLQPQKMVQVETNNKQQSHHIFIDLSPSHSSVASLEQIRTVVGEVYKSFRERVTFTISTTASPAVQDVATEADLNEYLKSLQFHTAGVRLGQAVRDRFDAIGDVDRLYFVSDRDFHSWSDFQWRYLSDKVDMYTVRAGEVTPPTNVFINGAVDVTEKLSDRSEWEVELSRTSANSNSQGKIFVERNGKKLVDESWTFPSGGNQIKIKLSWFEEQSARKKEKMRFVITPDTPDSIVLDNTFNVESQTVGSKALVIVDQGGELQLEDPAHHFMGSLEVLGFQLDRLDHLPEEAIDLEDYSFVAIAGGTGNGLDDYCPYISFRKALNDKTTAPKVWLYPISQNADYQELCHCLAVLKDLNTSTRNAPDYCTESNSRSSWAFLLKSIGARSVGGEIDMQQSSVAWILKNSALQNEILSFTMPLNPRIPRGFSFAQFPLLMRTLLDWQNLISTTTGATQWPRIEDISVHYSKPELVSNVPYGESNLKQVDLDQLPEIWQRMEGDEFKTSFVKKQAFTPVPWIKALVLLILALVGAEFFFSVVRAIKKRKLSTDVSKAVSVLLFLIASPDLMAQVSINAIGYKGSENSSHLAFEISSRTSIELEKRVLHRSNLNKRTLSYPWLWSKGLSKLTDASGRLQVEIVNWIKNGGFLVIENTTNQEQLDRAIKDHFTHHAFTPEWKPIPPDHEIMRSFYLLDALPVCNGQTWQGFLFDGRLAILVIPYRFLESLTDGPISLSCKTNLNREQMVRTFVNTLMVALATDYKKDQIHLPEILKRLR